MAPLCIVHWLDTELKVNIKQTESGIDEGEGGGGGGVIHSP